MKKLSVFTGLFVFAMALCGHASAQEISLDESSGVLTINGTNDDDDCWISVYDDDNDPGEDDLRLRVDIVTTEADGDEDETDEEFDATQVSVIVFYGKDGDDSFEVFDQAFMQIMGLDITMYLYGERGKDNLSGGPGDDFLVGGDQFDGYQDVLTGNTGSDTFYFPYVINQYKQIKRGKRVIRVPIKKYEDKVTDYSYSEGDVFMLENIKTGQISNWSPYTGP